MKFRLVFYDTTRDSPFDAEERYEYFGNRESIYNLWLVLKFSMRCKHLYIYSLDGALQEPEKGINGLKDYNI